MASAGFDGRFAQVNNAAEPVGGATPSKKAYPIGSFTLSGNPKPCGTCSEWTKPKARIPDGSSIEETDWLLRQSELENVCKNCKKNGY